MLNVLYFIYHFSFLVCNARNIEKVISFSFWIFHLFAFYIYIIGVLVFFSNARKGRTSILSKSKLYFWIQLASITWYKVSSSNCIWTTVIRLESPKTKQQLVLFLKLVWTGGKLCHRLKLFGRTKICLSLKTFSGCTLFFIYQTCCIQNFTFEIGKQIASYGSTLLSHYILRLVNWINHAHDYWKHWHVTCYDIEMSVVWLIQFDNFSVLIDTFFKFDGTT